MFGFTVIFIAQYYFNRKPDPKQKQPTRKFVGLSIAAIVFIYLGAITTGVILGVMDIQNDPQIQSSLAGNKELNELAKQTVLLEKQYTGCVKQLNESYPYIDEENELAYNDDEAICEDIRIEQNKAVSAYEALAEKLSNELKTKNSPAK